MATDARRRIARAVVRHRGWTAAQRPRPRRREQERRAADPRRDAARVRAGHAATTSRGSGTSRRCASCSPTSAPTSSGPGPNELHVDSSGAHKPELDAELCSRIRASFLLAGPLLARFGRAVGAAAGRRRDRPAPARPAHPCARRAGRRGRHQRPLRDAHRRPARPRDLPRRGERDGDRERGHGRRDRRRARRSSATPPASRTCRTSAASSARSARGSRGSARTCSGSRASSASAAASGGSRPSTSRSASFIGLAAVTGGELTIDDVVPADLVPILPGFARLGVQVERRRDSSVRVPPGQELVIQDDLGDQIPKIEDGPWPAFPADLTSIALAVATQAHGHDPDLREDVREPPLLRRQARQHGRADHPLRPAPRGRHRAREALRAAHGEPGHPRRDGDADREPLRRRRLDDRQHRRDRPRLRADRRAPARARRADRARREPAGGRSASASSRSASQDLQPGAGRSRGARLEDRRRPDDDVVFFQAGGLVVGLWSRDVARRGQRASTDTGGWGGITLAHNVARPPRSMPSSPRRRRPEPRSRAPGRETFWGGYSGVFVDPDGHPWEVAHNPHWHLAEDGGRSRVKNPDRPRLRSAQGEDRGRER